MMDAGTPWAQPGARAYHHLPRGPRFAWWRPPLAMALCLLFAFLFMLVPTLLFVLAGQRAAVSADFPDGGLPPAALAFMNLVLAALIPAALLASRLAHGTSAGYLSSVAGRIRWRWLMRCAVVTLPVYGMYLLLDLLLDPPHEPPPAQQGALLLLILTTTPMQAAGEEYLFRGLLVQNVGAWFRNSRLALLVSGVVSTVLFTAAHGSADPWIAMDLAVGAMGSYILVVRTGGLEAAIVLHAANNAVGMAASVLFGGWGEGFVAPESRGRPLDPLVTLLVTGIVVLLVLRQARRHGVQQVHHQPLQPGAGPGAAGLA